MSDPSPLPYSANLADYRHRADLLWQALKHGDSAARWNLKWMHPRFAGKPVAEVASATFRIDDAEIVIARQHAFETWAELAEFAEAVASHPSVGRFERAADAVVSGEVVPLQEMLRAQPALVAARSTRRHHATLLHYVAANGVEEGRQRTPPTAVAVATTLLEAGAEVDALADFYGHRCTTLSLLVSSTPPAEAGLQAALASTLLDHGAALVGPGTRWQAAVTTALAFGFSSTAEMLAGRGAPIDLAAAAGLGRLEDVVRLIPGATEADRHAAFALAAQHGRVPVVRMLLEAGGNPDRYNPDGFHAHSTPLHQAVAAGHLDTVRLLVDRGARLDIRDTLYAGTPLGWAVHGHHTAIADYLRRRGAPT